MGLYIINDLVSELQASQEKRLMIQFNIEEQRNLSKNIKKISYQLTKEIRYLEKSIQIYISTDIPIENEGTESITNFLQEQIKENMNQNILSEFFIFSKKFKLNQEIYLKKCEELVIEDDEEDKEINNAIEMNEISTTNSENDDNVQRSNSDQNFLMKDEPDLLLQERDNEIGNIVKGVNTLHEMFKDMNILVNEQGTILDRIDYNIDIGFDNVVKAKKKINNANESRKGSCFRNVILVLMLCIFVESIMILFKFF
jgi:syntaxin 16